MKKTQQNDALLALISTLTVVFVVLFISLTYFLNLRTDTQHKEALIWPELEQARLSAVQHAPTSGSVAGYETSR